MKSSALPASDQTLLALLAARAVESPAGTAFELGESPYSFGWLWEHLNGFAAGLQRAALRRGERVLVALPNSGEFFTAFYGIQRAGGIPVPIYPDSGEDRIAAVAARCGARRIVLDPNRPDLSISLERIPPGLYDQPQRPFPEVTPGATAYLQFTSGSTGDPKAVVIRQADLLTNIRQMIRGMAITAEDVFVSWLPAYHDMGLVLMTMTPFTLGARLVLLPTSFVTLRHWLAKIESVRGTFTAAPDFGYRLAMRYAAQPSKIDLSSLRVALNAAEPVRPETIRRFEEMFGLTRVMTVGYGLAEATVGVSMTSPGAGVRVDADGFASAGRPFPEIEIAILRESGILAKAGEEGEILVRSPANTVGYFEDPEASESLYWGDGFIRTGDIGYLAQDGDLFIIGRKKDMLKHAGQTFAPREVEMALDDHPGLGAAAAISADMGGLPGEQIIVFCELRKGKDANRQALHDLAVELVATIHARFGLRPGRLYLLKPRSIPLSPNGKLQRARLKKSFLEGQLTAEGRILYPDF